MHARKAETSRKRDLHVPTYKGSLVVTVTTAVNTKVRMKGQWRRSTQDQEQPASNEVV